MMFRKTIAALYEAHTKHRTEIGGKYAESLYILTTVL